ncbi:MAG: hypothetical protein R3F41_09600 [Gammaproteobacteria bacterium]
MMSYPGFRLPVQKLLLTVTCGLLGLQPVLAQEPPLPAGLGDSATVTEPRLPAGLDDNAGATAPALPAGLTGGASAQEPPLPGGLMNEPSLPGGLGGEPALPGGLGGNEAEPGKVSGIPGDSWWQSLPFTLSGFWEARVGARVQEDRWQKDLSLGESRLQLELQQDWDRARLQVTADLLFDPVLDRHRIDLERGQGWLDLRQASLLLRPADVLDLEVGRQVLTWGTGDLLFINDLFPKDWNSFFIGRQDEYLKAPSDAVKAAFFNDTVNVDVVYTPRFDSDRFIDGRRLSFFNPASGGLSGRSQPLQSDLPDRWFDDGELAVRLYRNLGSWESALYAYDGFWKSPGGMNPQTGQVTFPELIVLGGSLRGPLAAGIANFEVGYYDSREDRNGTNPLINNSEYRLLAGFEKELLPQLTLGLQYYLEWLQDYGSYRESLVEGQSPRDEKRHVFTTRLTRLLMSQNLTLSLFNYFSPSDQDGYLRMNGNYKLNDRWQMEVGGNLFYGDRRDTFFGQFEKNNNLYAGLRFSF